ncbi:MAG: hypothetical protein IJM25_01950 [Eubacterium sp.]|nr:hypothetical protein [Eubacterium sp.]
MTAEESKREYIKQKKSLKSELVYYRDKIGKTNDDLYRINQAINGIEGLLGEHESRYYSKASIVAPYVDVTYYWWGETRYDFINRIYDELGESFKVVFALTELKDVMSEKKKELEETLKNLICYRESIESEISTCDRRIEELNIILEGED